MELGERIYIYVNRVWRVEGTTYNLAIYVVVMYINNLATDIYS